MKKILFDKILYLLLDTFLTKTLKLWQHHFLKLLTNAGDFGQIEHSISV